MKASDTASLIDPGTLAERRSYWCSRVFAAAWIAYAGFNSCRTLVHWQPVPVHQDTSLSKLADLKVFFSLGYVCGQFVAGWAADQYGARRTLLFGGLISVLATISTAWNSPLMVFCILQIVNGFAQGFGWPAISKLFSLWLPRAEWAVGFAWWSTSYVLGSFLFSALSKGASRIGTLPPVLASLAPALAPACVLLLTTCFFYARTKDLPEDVGLEPINPPGRPPAESSGWKGILGNPTIRLLAVMYFFLKLTRYSLLFWLPLYLLETQRSERSSFALSSLLELAGFLGALIAAYVSERLLGGRRYPVGSTMLFLAAFIFLLHPVVWMLGKIAIGIGIACTGILVWGPDLLMTSVAVLEAVPLEQAGRASGFVDGVGSVGQMISPLVITMFVHSFGWDNLFNLFFFSTLIAASILAKNWNKSRTDDREDPASGRISEWKAFALHNTISPKRSQN